MDFCNQMLDILRSCDRDDGYDDALERVRTLRRQVEASRVPDRDWLRWARDVEIRCLYGAGRHEEGLALLLAGDEGFGTPDRTWLADAALEMARSVGRADLVLRFGGESFRCRLAARDEEGAVQVGERVLSVLEAARRPDLSDAFVAELEHLWERWPVGSNAAIKAAVVASRVARWGSFLRGLPERRARARALHDAAAAGDARAVRALLEGGAPPSDRDLRAIGLPTPLIAASFHGHEGAVALLLEVGAELEAINAQGRTALHQAAAQGHARVLRRLCEAGARIDAGDLHRQTPLHVAARSDHVEAVDVLVDAGAPIEAVDRNGDTPLALACGESAAAAARRLVARGARLDAANVFGQTPLHRAAMGGRREQVRVLLERGACPALRDRNGMTAGEWARHEGHAALAVHLERRAAAVAGSAAFAMG